jgi:hypothetical protein
MIDKEIKDSLRMYIETEVKKAKHEWYQRGLRDGREEVKAALRELLGFGCVSTDGNGITLPADTLKG